MVCSRNRTEQRGDPLPFHVNVLCIQRFFYYNKQVLESDVTLCLVSLFQLLCVCVFPVECGAKMADTAAERNLQCVVLVKMYFAFEVHFNRQIQNEAVWISGTYKYIIQPKIVFYTCFINTHNLTVKHIKNINVLLLNQQNNTDHEIIISVMKVNQ